MMKDPAGFMAETREKTGPASVDTAEEVGEEFRDLSVWRYRGPALAVGDAVVVVSSFLIAYYLRFHMQFLAIKYVAAQEVGSYLKGAAILAAVWVYLVWRDGGYESGLRGIASPIIRIRSMLIAGVKALAVLMVISYMYRGLLLSRQVYLMTGVFAFGGMILLRMLFRELDRDLASQLLAIQRVVVAGLDEQSEDFGRRLARAGGTVQLMGFVTPNRRGENCGAHESFAGRVVLGALAEISDIYAKHPFDKLVLSSASVGIVGDAEESGRLIDIVNFCEANNISLYTLPNVFNVAVSQSEVGTFSGVPVVRLRDASLHKGYAVAKRITDVTIALMALALGFPLWLLIALLIRITSRGAIIFTQVRAGLYGRPFRMYKFRSMVADAPKRLKELVDISKLEVPGFKLRGDPRVTPLGRILRRTGLDEIPQLMNVLKGQMSIVGPRPELPELVERYNPWQCRRPKAKPGITGYQQVMARGKPLAAAIEYDLIYLKHQCLLLDLYIMLRTVWVILRGSGVSH